VEFRAPAPKYPKLHVNNSSRPATQTTSLPILGVHRRTREAISALLRRRPFLVQYGTTTMLLESTIQPVLRPVLKATLFPLYAHMGGTPPVNLSIYQLVVVPTQARNLRTPGLRAVSRVPRIRSTRMKSAKAMAMTSQPHSDQHSRTRSIRSGQDLGVWKRLLHVAARPSVSAF